MLVEDLVCGTESIEHRIEEIYVRGVFDKYVFHKVERPLTFSDEGIKNRWSLVCLG